MRIALKGSLRAVSIGLSAIVAVAATADDCTGWRMAAYSGCSKDHEISQIELGSYCGNRQGACEAEYENKKVFGSIAYSKRTGAAGWSGSHDAKHDAESTALSQCAENAADCEVVVTFSNSCAAVAIGDDGVIVAKLAKSGDDAGDAAVAACSDAGGGDSCAVQAWSCSFP